MNKKLCLRPSCGQPQRTRGLCNRCYTSACSLVRRGRTTWVILQEQGRVLPKQTKTATGVTAWLLGVGVRANG